MDFDENKRCFRIGWIKTSFKSAFYSELEINGEIYKISHLDSGVFGGKLHIDVELEGKSICGNNFILSFYDDGKVKIRYGDTAFSIDKIEIDKNLDLMKITYTHGEEKPTTEYSFNLKSLDEQLKTKYTCKKVLGENQRSVCLKEELFETLGYNALKELENRIESTDEGSRVVLYVYFDNGKRACWNERFQVEIPSGAGKITGIEIITFKELSEPKQLAINVSENPENTNLKGQLGHTIAKEVYVDKILTEISERTGIPKDAMKVVY
ncbi:MAG: hypothetical protein FGF48_07610 [Candidatus Brockarchaeota archaeon]|nr:hypothetical protein [Candidatus Brockarchaeota archaeon]